MKARAAWVLAATTVAGCASSPGAAPHPEPYARRVVPAYPSEAFRQKVQGCVLVAFKVGAEGLADDYQVLDAVPKGVFEAITMHTVNQWRFVSHAQPARYALRVDFRIPRNARPVERECAAPDGLQWLTPILVEAHG